MQFESFEEKETLVLISTEMVQYRKEEKHENSKEVSISCAQIKVKQRVTS